MRPLVVLGGAICAGLALMMTSADAVGINSLTGSWVLAKSGSRVIVQGARELPNFTIKNGTISGYDGCNRFGGPLDQPGHIRQTRRACAAQGEKLPLDLNDALAHLKSGHLSGGNLVLPARGGLPASEFRRR